MNMSSVQSYSQKKQLKCFSKKNSFAMLVSNRYYMTNKIVYFLEENYHAAHNALYPATTILITKL